MRLLRKLFGLLGGGAAAPPRPRAPRRAEPPADFSNPITVEYVNFRGEQKTFTADPKSIRARGSRLSMRVAPTGTRIALGRDKIANLGLVEQALEQAVEEAAPAVEHAPPADFSNPVTVEYVNFRGEQKTFTADPKSIRAAGRKHLSMCVAPEGIRITLKRDNVRNLSSVEQALREG